MSHPHIYCHNRDTQTRVNALRLQKCNSLMLTVGDRVIMKHSGSGTAYMPHMYAPFTQIGLSARARLRHVCYF